MLFVSTAVVKFLCEESVCHMNKAVLFYRVIIKLSILLRLKIKSCQEKMLCLHYLTVLSIEKQLYAQLVNSFIFS